MSYPEDLSINKNLQNLLFKKEFAQLKIPNIKPVADINQLFLNEQILKENVMILHSHQLFAKNFINPNTPYTRFYVKHDPGTGKTILALSLALPFIEYYSLQHKLTEESGYSQTPLIYVIGFSKNIFQRELLRRPEFGFITRDEIAEFKRLKYLAETGTKADREVFAEFESRIKKRLSKKNRGGFFKFFGYKEFFNRIFIFAEDFVQTEETVITEEQIRAGLQAGSIKLNFELIDSFYNSLIICDEIHNVYNSIEINNYGIALQILLDIFDSPETIAQLVEITPERITMYKNSMLRAVFMSATPLNNSPTEIIDLLNLLVPVSRLPGQKKVRKEDFFEDQRNLKPGSLDKIQKLVQGYVSFLRDNNPKYYPETIFKGCEIKIPDKLLSERIKTYKNNVIPYLKFIRCPMSKFHQHTYDKVYTGTLPPDGQSLIDLVLPNPGLIEDEPKDIGLFKTKDIKYSLSNASNAWLDKNKIRLEKIPETNNVYITGEFMRMPELGKYSSKYAQLITDLIDNLENDGGKVIINHQFVKMSGVLFICEALRKNGFIDEHASPTEETLCSKCGVKKNKHNATRQGHDFIPARFIEYHGDIDKASLDRSLEKFRSNDNVNGYNYRILVGSKIINEGIDFNAVRTICVMVAPANIPTLVQILGRAVRKNSHIGLPPEKWNVQVRIYTSASNTKSSLSYEEHKYFDKSQDYLVIQQIEKIFNETALDAVIHRDIIAPAHYWENRAELGMLYFQPSDIFGKRWREIANGDEIKMRELDLSTFRAYHSDEEIAHIIYIIKRAFIEQSPVWTYAELWDFIREPPFEMHVNTRLFLEDNYLIALHFMTRFIHDNTLIDAYQIMNIDADNTMINRLFDHLDRKIIIADNEYQIVFINDYYILFPVQYETIEREDGGKAPPSYLGINSKNINGILDIDIDNWCRKTRFNKSATFHITKYLRTSNINYNQMKFKFYNQFKDIDIELLPTSTEVYEIDFHIKLIEDSIKYAFNILTNPDAPVSELHNFYFKMLYFYSKLELILFADQIQNHKAFEYYKPYVTHADLKFEYGTKHKLITLIEDHKYNPFLMSSIMRSSEDFKFDINRLNDFIGKKIMLKPHIRLEDVKLEKYNKPKRIKKVFSNMLPIGHFLNNTTETGNVSIPKIYVPDLEYNKRADDAAKTGPWTKLYDFAQIVDLKNIVENNLIIGYYEKSVNSIDVKFKLRLPVQKIELHEDSRLIERGSACSTRKKEDLMELAGKLGIKINSEEYSIKNICNEIKINLMTREMKSRRYASKHPNEKRIKWFYLHFEPQIDYVVEGSAEIKKNIMKTNVDKNNLNNNCNTNKFNNMFDFARELYAINLLTSLKNSIINCINKYFGDKKSLYYFEKAFIRWIFNLNNLNCIKNFYIVDTDKFKQLVLTEIDNYIKYEYNGKKSLSRFIFNFNLINENLNKLNNFVNKSAINLTVQIKNNYVEFNADNLAKINIPKFVYEKLHKYYTGDIANINEKIYIIYQRYFELGGINQHLSIPIDIVQKFDMELFGTPLNTILPKFCSPFIDIDAEFGSRGNFFDYAWESGLKYTCNPPYDLTLMNAMADKVLQQLARVACDVLIVLPVWDPETQNKLNEKNYNIEFPAYTNLIKSPYYINGVVMPKNQAIFYNYFTDKYITPGNIHLLILSSNSAPGIDIENIKSTWIASVQSQLE